MLELIESILAIINDLPDLVMVVIVCIGIGIVCSIIKRLIKLAFFIFIIGVLIITLTLFLS